MSKYGIDYNKLPQAELNDMFGRFCLYEDLNEIKYLLTSPNLKNRPNIHYNWDASFAQLLNDESIEILKYLIFEQNMEKTEKINTLLGAWPNEFRTEITKMFAVRDLSNSLNQELEISEDNTKRMKI